MGRGKGLRDFVEKPLCRADQKPEFTPPDVIAHFQHLASETTETAMNDVLMCVVKCMTTMKFQEQLDWLRKLGTNVKLQKN